MILKGTRNFKDALWDITLHKTALTQVNHHIPCTHVDMYMARNVPVNTSTNVHTPARDRQPKILSAYHVQRIKKGTLTTILKQQAKADSARLHQVDLNNHQHKMVVIVRKQQTKKRNS